MKNTKGESININLPWTTNIFSGKKETMNADKKTTIIWLSVGVIRTNNNCSLSGETWYRKCSQLIQTTPIVNVPIGIGAYIEHSSIRIYKLCRYQFAL